DAVRLRAATVGRALALGQVAAKVVQEDADAALLGRLRDVVGGPVLLVDLLLGERHAPRPDDRSVGQHVALMDKDGGVVVLAGVATFNVVWAGAGLCIEVDDVAYRRAVRLARAEPGAVVILVEPAGCCDENAALLSGVHEMPLSLLWRLG